MNTRELIPKDAGGRMRPEGGPVRVYLDHNATTPLATEVRDVMRSALDARWGNASSVHAEGREARRAVDVARAEVADLLGVKPRTVFWTSGATESNHLAIRGLAEASSEARRTVITTQVEHPSVLGAVDALAASGWTVVHIGVDSQGRLDEDGLVDALDASVALVSVMHANNETGVLFDVRRVADRAHAVGALVHVDAAQTAGRLVWSAESLGADAISLSAHKMCGPKGIGALHVRTGVPFNPLLPGGHQERGLRPGTENVDAIVGFGCAARIASQGRAHFAETVGADRDALWEALQKRIPGIRRNGGGALLSNTLNVAVEGCAGDALLQSLDLAGIAASSGSACTSGTVEPSHVLRAMGQSHDVAKEAVRFSLGVDTSPRAMDRVVEVFGEGVDRIQAAEGLLEDWGKTG
jgi:cysteine desulfurase